MAATFQQVFAAAVQKYSTDEWLMLPQRDQAAAVYKEMRRLDADGARADLVAAERADTAARRKSRAAQSKPLRRHKARQAE